jgi:hypothetical protein
MIPFRGLCNGRWNGSLGVNLNKYIPYRRILKMCTLLLLALAVTGAVYWVLKVKKDRVEGDGTAGSPDRDGEKNHR